MNKSATIKLFLLFGDPKRLRTAELSNWSGKAIAAPRSDLESFITREELQKPGIYFLLGVDPLHGNPKAYIGEGEVVSDRIKQHKSKDFWNSAIVFVSKDSNLTKSHIKYLEGRLIETARTIGRFKLENAQKSGATLPESDQSDMEAFLDRLQQLFPVLGSDLLTPVKIDGTNLDLPQFLCKMKGAEAKGDITPNGFVVYKGSTAVLEERKSSSKNGSWVFDLRKRLKQEKGLIKKGQYLSFAKDSEFSSPSAAAAVIVGGNAPGPVMWKDKSGKTLKELEENG